MKFAAPYQLEATCPIDYGKIAEFNIEFTKYNSFKSLGDFAKKYSFHQINVSFSEENYDIDAIIDFCKKYDNVYIRIHPWEFQFLSRYKMENINYIFDITIPIYSYSLLEWTLSSGVKGIYIADDLTYNLPEVYKQCEDRGIKLRIILNHIPATNPLSLTCPSVQIYRPQDYDFLSQYYAVGEFDCGEKYDWTKAEVLYRKWFVEHDCSYDLEFMNQDLQLPFPTKSIPPELTRLRSVCRHRCMMSYDNKCSKCKRLLLLGYQNADNHLIYKNSEHALPSLEEMVDTITISKKEKEE